LVSQYYQLLHIEVVILMPQPQLGRPGFNLAFCSREISQRSRNPPCSLVEEHAFSGFSVATSAAWVTLPVPQLSPA